MSCPSCGTENSPDSRFCGVCGAKQGADFRVAPTTKILDDAPYPAPLPSGRQILTPVPGSLRPLTAPVIPPTAQRLASVPPGAVQHPGSIPPIVQRPASLPPTEQRPPSSVQRTATASPPPQLSSPSLALAARPNRRWGLVIAILIADLGLAVAGAAMLGKGLSRAKPDARPEPAAKPASEPAAAPRPDLSAPPAPAPQKAASEPHARAVERIRATVRLSVIP